MDTANGSGGELKTIAAYRVSTDKYQEEILLAFKEVLDSGMFVLGEKTEKFETIFKESHGRKHGISVNSDTAALEACLTLLQKEVGRGVGKKTIVMLPDAAFFGCANVILKMGMVPFVLPITVSNGVMPTVTQLEEAIASLEGNSPLIYMAVYTAGTVGADALEAIALCEKYGIPVVEDCAHVHSARYSDGRLVGSAGRFATFSFYATKLIHSGEGGIILTDNDADAEFLRTYRNYGKRQIDPVFADSCMVGYNWRITEFQAALAGILWGHREEIHEDRSKAAEVYDS